MAESQRSAIVAAAPTSNSRRLLRRLESIYTLSDAEREAIVNLPMQVTDLQADQDIVREGDRPSRSCLILEGYACTYKVTQEGKRQIVAFHIPGDVPDLQSLHLRVLDNSVGTITPCKLGLIQHETLDVLCARYPRITIAFWRETLIDAGIYRQWMTSIGRRDAHSRIAHLLCEWAIRMKAVGLAEDHTCELPITQAELGDALGLSTVHVNRTLQDLRAAGLITLNGKLLTVLDCEGLKEVGDFDPTYLHLRNREAA